KEDACRDWRLGRAQLDADSRTFRADAGAEPIDTAQCYTGSRQLLARSHDHAPRIGLETQHVEWFGRCHAEALALADRETDDAVMAAEDAPAFVDDLAGLRRAGAELLHERRVVAAGDEADVLAVRLRRDGQREAFGERARLGLGK